MTTPANEGVTQLLLAWSDGDQTALERLIPLVYEELRRFLAPFNTRLVRSIAQIEKFRWRGSFHWQFPL